MRRVITSYSIHYTKLYDVLHDLAVEAHVGGYGHGPAGHVLQQFEAAFAARVLVVGEGHQADVHGLELGQLALRAPLLEGRAEVGVSYNFV